MLLAAGTGTRLRPLTDKVPKPLAPIANVPLICRTLGRLAAQGVTEAAVNAHHHAQQVVEIVGDGSEFGLSAWVSIEVELLGSSGAVKKCAEFFRGSPFFVIYGDNLIDADLKALYEFHKSRKAEATLALFTPPDISTCGAVELEPDGKVSRFVEKPKPGETDSKEANAGIYVVDPHLLDSIPDGFSDFGKDIFPAWIEQGISVYATSLGGYLQDTGTPQRYSQANWDVLEGRTIHKPAGKNVLESWIDDGSEIDRSSLLVRRNLIGKSVTVGPKSKLADCIVWPGAKIGAGCELIDVIVGQGTVVPDGTRASSTILA